MSDKFAFAQELDAQDELKHFRSRFFIPQHEGKEVIYLCGNSLGLQPKTASEAIQKELNKWADYGVEGHFVGEQPWWQFRKPIKPLLAEILGAKPTEVAIMNSLTTNLHLLLVSFYNPQGKRKKVLMEAGAFPSDQYALETHLHFRGVSPDENIIEVAPQKNEHILQTEQILETIEKLADELALVIFGGVNYYTGQVFEMQKITQKAHQVGAVVGFDLAHAVGNVKLDLHAWQVDFATWCSYKYLNSGPGGVSGIFIHEKHHNKDLPRFGGWWGQVESERFLMKKGFKPIPDADGWQLSNEPILPMALHQASLQVFHEATMDKLVAKSNLLTHYLYEWLIEFAGEHIEIITPKNPPHRAAQLSIFAKSKGKELHQYLLKNGIITDWREPNVVRMAPVPLYNTFTEVFLTAQKVAEFYK
ncbi:kynureninase [Raineya orbicola]|jgi:kynureninase|uniref:Kynureninase n=1 Tax=Raineya orbicola TaxID=2016530 RepID=A0A2N3IHH5_9BACT|nr:kynureninase [Raineya orbicola]PKQ69779.1 Kynureninase [Raineya orbicola]